MSQNQSSAPRDSLITVQLRRSDLLIMTVLAVSLAVIMLLGLYGRRSPESASKPQTAAEQKPLAATAPAFRPQAWSNPDTGNRPPEKQDYIPVTYPGDEATSNVAIEEPFSAPARLNPVATLNRPRDMQPMPVAPQPASDPEPPQPAEIPLPSITAADHSTTIRGAGATFPSPIYSKWFNEFHTLHPQITINYQSNGSGAGIRLVTEGRIDFAASDGPMTDQQLKESKVPILHIPTVLAAIVPIYNIPGVQEEVRFTPEMLAGIFLGKILYWDDELIRHANPNIQLPQERITVIHRAEGTAATFVFTDYLCKVSLEWNQKVGKGTSVPWPTGLGQQGDEAVFKMVRQLPGAIGYGEMIHALQNKAPYGPVRNSMGKFIKATFDTVEQAAASAEIPPDFRVSITNAPGENAYPISSFTWLLLPESSGDPSKTKDMVAFLDWMIDSGESMAKSLDYAPLPKSVARKVRKKIAELANGERL